MPEQRRIAGILDQADALRRKRAEAIRLVGELVPSVFHELFGDPRTNPKGWPSAAIREHVIDSQYGTAEKANDQENGLPVLRMNNITYEGQLDLRELKWCEIPEADRPRLLASRLAAVGQSGGKVLFTPNV